tara:strand:- start:5741 stop:6238 length:498 start_codon:yes stop_codon:yes gene_type:complete
MKITQKVLLGMILALLITGKVTAQSELNKKETMTSKETVNAFFTAFGNGNYQGILDVFDPEVEIMAVRKAPVASGELYGSYEGIEGLKAFLTNMGNVFDTKAFSVEHVIGEGNVAFANGTFAHEIKPTGKLYSSAWSLMCEVEDGKITVYRFYEDTAKYEEASEK